MKRTDSKNQTFAEFLREERVKQEAFKIMCRIASREYENLEEYSSGDGKFVYHKKLNADGDAWYNDTVENFDDWDDESQIDYLAKKYVVEWFREIIRGE